MLYKFRITGVALNDYNTYDISCPVDITIYSDTEQNALSKAKSVLGYPIAKHNRKIVVEEVLNQAGSILEIKQQAYKEFAEKLKQHKRKMKGFDLNEEFWDYVVLVETIDNILEEMVGEVNENL